jgi:hypothetical protein
MSQEDESDTMREAYDCSGGVRGQHAQAYRQGTHVVRLGPDVAHIFTDAATVTSALRLLAQIAQEHVSKEVDG